MWRNKLVLVVHATLLGSLAFCLDTSSFPGAATTAGRIGRLIVGKGVRLASNETEANNDGQKDGFAGDTEGYQSDQAVSTDERKLQYLNPSVHCGDDSMALHVKGTRMPNFMVDRGEEGPIHVSKMPSHCGYSVRRARRDVHIIVPYQGCNVAQQGDDYVLPLRLWSLPMQMSCPATPFMGASGVSVTAPAGPASDPQVLEYPFQPAYPAAPPYYPPGPTGYSSYWVQPTPYSAATSPTTTVASNPQFLGYPFQPAYPLSNPYASPYYPPGPTSYSGYWVPLPSSDPAGLASDPQFLEYPFQPANPDYTWPYYRRPMHYRGHWDHHHHHHAHS